jgi:putative FmdB family regulatory protein
MPIYTYVCSECGEQFDILVGVVANSQEIKCKKCGSKNVERKISAFSIGKGSFSSSQSSYSTGTCQTST